MTLGRADLAALSDLLAAEGEDDDEEDDDDTPASRFCAALAAFLLRGFGAKDKNVRYRCCQTLAAMLPAMTDIELVPPAALDSATHATLITNGRLPFM